ncbi:MAG: AsmA family protein [Nitrospirota bacterium]
MATLKKKILYIALLLLGIFIAGMIAVSFIVDLKAYRSAVESTASDFLGMEVRIKGDIGIDLIPRFSISLKDVHVKNEGTEVAEVGKIKIGVKIIPLLKREIKITELRLLNPNFLVEKIRDGRLNITVRGAVPGGFTIRRLTVSDGRGVYLDRKSERKIEMEGVDFDIRNFSYEQTGDENIFKKVSFSGTVRCKKMSGKNFRIDDVESGLTAQDGTFSLSPLSLRALGALGKGRVTIISSGQIPVFAVSLQASGLNAERLFASFSGRSVLRGSLDFSSELEMRGKNWYELKRTMDGGFAFSGRNLTLSVDLDKLIAAYEKSQNFNLVDMGAFFFVGPMGAVLTKGYDFAGIYKGARGESTVRRLVSRWRIENGIADAEDVALSTQGNRVAFRGKLDFTRSRYLNATVAVVDKRGCAKFSQQLRGPFGRPRIEKVNVFGSIVGPFVGLIERAKRIFIRDCKAFYSGSVAHP